MRANACVRKKRNSTPELWRPCHLRSGYGDEPITRVKNPQASKRHRKHEKVHFLEWLLGRFRAKNGGSQEPAKRRTFPIFAGTHRFSWSKIGDFALGHGTIWISGPFVCSHWASVFGHQNVQIWWVRNHCSGACFAPFENLRRRSRFVSFFRCLAFPPQTQHDSTYLNACERSRMRNTERSWRTWCKTMVRFRFVSLVCFYPSRNHLRVSTLMLPCDYRYVAISWVKDETRDVALKEVLVGVPAKFLIKLGSWFKMFLSRKWSVSHKLILKHCRSGGLSGQFGVDIGSWLLTRLTPQKSTSKN